MTAENINREGVKDDPSFQELIRSRNLKPSSAEMYFRILSKYCEFMEMTPTQLIEEAEEDEENRLRMRQRRIKSRLIQYVEHLKGKDLSPKYIQTSMVVIKSFYSEFEIQNPKMRLNLEQENNNTTNDDILTKDHIKLLMANANMKYRAIISLMMSSGMGGAEARSLTISDLKCALNIENQDFDIPELIKKHSQNPIVPTWHIKRIKTGMPYFTFSSPESVSYILEFLLKRKNTQGTLNDDAPIFDVKGRFLSHKATSEYFRNLNDKCGFNLKDNERSRFFTGHGFRSFFASKLTEKGIQQLIIDWLLGHSIDKVTGAYFKPNPKALKNEYLKVLPYLTLEDIETKTLESEELKKLEKLESKYKKLEKDMELMEQMLEKQRLKEETPDVRREILGS